MELKQAPTGPTNKKNLGAPRPPTGEIRGVKVSTSPPYPSISLRQISEIFRPRAGLEPGYNARDFGKSAGNAAGDIFTFILAPGPRYKGRTKTYKTESFILLDTPPHSQISFRMPRPTKFGIKVISTSFGFAAVERQTIKRKTLKIWVKFGVAAPGPWGDCRDLTPRGH